MKIYIFSHDADIDGMGCVALAKLSSDCCDYTLVSYKNVDEKINEKLNDGSLKGYDKVFVTDICPSRETLERLSKELKRKVVVIDHHPTALNNNDLRFCHIEVEKNSEKACATSLLYDYLVKAGWLDRSPYIEDFVYLTRLSDTWEWHALNETDADDLAELFNVIKEDYINMAVGKVKSHNKYEVYFNLNETELGIVEKRRELLSKVYGDAERDLRIENVDGVKVAVCDIDYDFRNGFSQYLRDKNVEADVMAIADFDKGTMSFRYLREGFSAGDFAKKFGGGGGVAAAGCHISQDVIDALKLKQPEAEENSKI